MPLISQAVKAGTKLAKMDKSSWDKLYFGIRNDIKQGIRTGFGIGQVAGIFIDDEDEPSGDGSFRSYEASSKPQTYSRQAGRSTRKYRNTRRSCNCKRRSSTRRRSRSSNRRYRR